MENMALDLNSVVVPYKEFYGQNREQMPKLIAEGRVPLSVAGVMDRRLNSDKPDWKANYFDTGDAIVYHPDGKFKLVRDASFLREITSKSRLTNGALALEAGFYESLDGAEFSRNDKGLLLDADMPVARVKAHPVWQHLARDNKVLGAYVDAMFPEMKKDFGYDQAMGVFVASAPKEPNARALYVYRLEYGSRLYGGSYLGIDDGRLVGVAPEALSAPGQVIQVPSLEQALAVVGSNWDKVRLRKTQ